MKTTLDRFGRIVVPKDIRDRLGLHSGVEVEINEQGGTVLLKPAEGGIPLEMEDGVLVYKGTAKSDLIDAVRLHREARLKSAFSKKS